MATPHCQLERKDSAGQHYLVWKGPVTTADSDLFNYHNRETVHQLVLTKYPKMKLNAELYSISVEEETENFEISNENEDWALKSLLHAIPKMKNSLEMIHTLKRFNVKKGGAYLPSSSDGEDDSDQEEGRAKRRRMDEDSGYLTTEQLLMLIPLMQDLARCYTALYRHTPVFRNDTVKAFLVALLKYSLFDLLHCTEQLMSTNTNAKSQRLGLTTVAVHDSATTRARITVKGVPDVGVFVTVGNQEQKVLFCEGKSADDERNQVIGEGQLVLAMLCAFVEAGGAYKVYGVLLSPSCVDVFCVSKEVSKGVVITKLYSCNTSENTHSILDYSFLITYVRMSVLSVLNP